MTGKIAGLIAAGMLAVVGADDVSEWVNGSTNVAGPVSIQNVVDAAYYDWQANGGDWEDALNRAVDTLHRGQMDLYGTLLRWQHGDACWELDAENPNNLGEPTVCE